MGKDGTAHQVQRVCFLGLPQAALLGSNAILLPPLDFPHVIRRVLGKQGMEMTGASPPLLCFSCRAVGGKGTQQKNITEVHDMGYTPSAQRLKPCLSQGCVMLLASPLIGGASLIPLGILTQLGNDHSVSTKTQAWNMAVSRVRASLQNRDNLNSLYRRPLPLPCLCKETALQTFQVLG